MSEKDPKDLSTHDPDKPMVLRDEKGRFVKGYSGNPAGKPKGVRHRSTLIKETIDASMADMLHEEFIPVMQKAIEMAKKGDRAMIKLLLGDFLNEVRKHTEDEEDKSKGTRIIIENLTIDNRQQEESKHEYRIIEGEAVRPGEQAGEGRQLREHLQRETRKSGQDGPDESE